jgi:hypothetical protein
LPIGAQVTIDIAPVVLPTVCGAKVTLRLTLCCGGRLKGKVGPEKLKPFPVTFARKMVRLDLALLVTVNGSVCALLTGTIPKFRPDVENASWPFAVGVDRRNARRMKFHQARLHWKMRGLMGRLSFPVLTEHGGGLWSCLSRR